MKLQEMELSYFFESKNCHLFLFIFKTFNYGPQKLLCFSNTAFITNIRNFTGPYVIQAIQYKLCFIETYRLNFNR